MKDSTKVRLADRCDVAYAVDMIGGRWKISIIWELERHGQSRLSQLRRMLLGISEGVLIEQLKQLERDAIVERIDFKQMPPRVEYALTKRGHNLVTTIKDLDKWGAACRQEEVALQIRQQGIE